MKKQFNRINLSMGETHQQMLKPLIEKHQGNASSAMRECIEFADYAIKKTGSIERAKEILTLQTGDSSLRSGDQLILEVVGVVRSKRELRL